MKLHHAYEGMLNGVNGTWTDELPEGVVLEKEFLFITADGGEKELRNKETGETRGSVIIKQESETGKWEEVDIEIPIPRKDKKND